MKPHVLVNPNAPQLASDFQQHSHQHMLISRLEACLWVAQVQIVNPEGRGAARSKSKHSMAKHPSCIICRSVALCLSPTYTIGCVAARDPKPVENGDHKLPSTTSLSSFVLFMILVFLVFRRNLISMLCLSCCYHARYAWFSLRVPLHLPYRKFLSFRSGYVSHVPQALLSRFLIT